MKLKKNSLKNFPNIKRVKVLPLDVSDDKSVLEASEKVKEEVLSNGIKLYGIVNNAGVMLPESQLGMVLQVNVYGIHRVLSKFMPLLEEENGRVINITSAAGPSFVSTCSETRKNFFMNSDVFGKL